MFRFRAIEKKPPDASFGGFSRAVRVDPPEGRTTKNPRSGAERGRTRRRSDRRGLFRAPGAVLITVCTNENDLVGGDGEFDDGSIPGLEIFAQHGVVGGTDFSPFD